MLLTPSKKRRGIQFNWLYDQALGYLTKLFQLQKLHSDEWYEKKFMNSEYVGIWKVAVMTYLKVLFMFTWIEEKHDNLCKDS